MQVVALDHVVLRVQDLERSIAFYEQVLGMWPVTRHDVVSMHFDGGAVVLVQDSAELRPEPAVSARGAAVLCLRASGTVEQWRERVRASGVLPVAGPTSRIGSAGAVHSVHVRDPDGNVVEIDLSPRAR